MRPTAKFKKSRHSTILLLKCLAMTATRRETVKACLYTRCYSATCPRTCDDQDMRVRSANTCKSHRILHGAIICHQSVSRDRNTLHELSLQKKKKKKKRKERCAALAGSYDSASLMESLTSPDVDMHRHHQLVILLSPHAVTGVHNLLCVKAAAVTTL